MSFLYLKTVLTVPGLPPFIHIAELEPIDAGLCRTERMLELSADQAVTGAYRRAPAALHNFATPPQQTLPHPDHWGDLDGISATSVTQSEFETLWLEAEQKFDL
ncbi:hypothetical protein QVA66_09665 [Staphylococcus chromogenes]|nr:hypothetical protein [Staphylococcus chromogenes]